jgi:hypothetical protein
MIGIFGGKSGGAYAPLRSRFGLGLIGLRLLAAAAD